MTTAAGPTKTKGRSLLIVDDGERFAQRLARAMEQRDFKVRVAFGVEQAIEIARQEPPDFAVVDLRLGSDSGLEVVQALPELRSDTRIIMLTGYGNIATAVAAVKVGATDHLPKPAYADQIEAALIAQEGSLPPPPEQPMSVDRVRREHIQRAYAQCAHNVSEPARQLGLHRRTLQRILSKYAPKG